MPNTPKEAAGIWKLPMCLQTQLGFMTVRARGQFWKEVSNLYYLCRYCCTDICLVKDQVLRVKYLDQESYGKVNMKINAKV